MGCRPGARFCPSRRFGSSSPTCRASPIRRARPLDERSRERRHRQQSSKRRRSFCKRRSRGASRAASATAGSRWESERRWALRGSRSFRPRSAWASRLPVAPPRLRWAILHADGLMAKRILPLTQALLIVSAVVVVIITALVLIAVFRRGARRCRCGHSAPGKPGRRVDPNRRRPLHDRAGRPGRLDFHDDG